MTLTAPDNRISDERIITAMSCIDWDFAAADTSGFTHSFHPYPAKFIPQISKTLIDFLTSPGDTVGDVFCGSGTTLVEAVRNGRNAIGIDANPLATLIARVKCRPLNSEERDAVLKSVQNAANLVGNYYNAPADAQSTQLDLFQVHPAIPPIPDLDFWFPVAAQNELALIKQVIDACSLEFAHEFMQVAFSSIIVNVSYQDSDTRYTRRDKGLKERETLRKWQARVVDMLEIIRQFDSLPQLGAICTLAADSRCLTGIQPQSVDLVVTSPPYPNAYSYHLYHRFRMEWLGFDQPRFKHEEIGSHRKYSAKGDKGATAQTFLDEMTDVLHGVAQMLKPGKLCVLVVGDSIIRGAKIDNAAITCAAGQAAGLRHVLTLNREILSGRKAFNPVIGKIRQEHIVFLRKP